MAQRSFIRKGYLSKCPQKALNPFKQKWQSRWFLLYGNSEQGRVRLEYHDNEKTWQQEKGKRIIPLGNCVSIKPVRTKEYHHVIEVVIQDKTIHLAALTKEDEKSWFKDLCKAVFGNSNRNSIVQVVEKTGSEHDFGYHSLDRSITEGIIDTDSPRLHTVEESLNESDPGSREELRSMSASSGGLNDNVSIDGVHGSQETLRKTLTSSVASELSSLVSFESGFDDAASLASTITDGSSYPVTVRPTIASQNSGMSGTYLIQVNPLTIALIDIPSQSPVCEWPIQFLRRYGRGRTKFSFEANEKCKYGKGVYTFNTLEGDNIFHLVDMHARGISMRNKMLRKRTSVPEGFNPLSQVSKKLHHSEGKLIDKCPESSQNNARYSDSVSDMLTLNPSDSVSQTGTLPKSLQDAKSYSFDNDSSRLPSRGMSIGSGISLEIAQNMANSADESKNNTPNHCTTERKLADYKRADTISDSSFDEESLLELNKPMKRDVSVIEEETLAQTLEPDNNKKDLKTLLSNLEESIRANFCSDDNTKKVKRSSSLKLPSALKRSNSNKDASIKKSQSVKRSSSFRNRFFKSKSSDEDKTNKVDKKEKTVSKSSQSLNTHQEEESFSNVLEEISGDTLDKKIAQHEKVKDYLAKAIEDDMTRSSIHEASLYNKHNNDNNSKNDQRSKRRRFPTRHKSNEMLGNGTPDKSKLLGGNRTSNSFAGYDYRGHMVLSRTDYDDNESDEVRWLQRRTQSVMKKVELYEGLKRQAEEGRSNTYTFWRRKQNSKIPETSDV